jgi:ribonucleoside-diphosphate reductase alpha chain
VNRSNKILSDVTVFNKYAKYVEEKGRRETWEELVTRNKEMHQRSYPQIAEEIESAYKYVYDKKVLPSMRSLQFGGRPIEVANNRIYNCGQMRLRYLLKRISWANRNLSLTTGTYVRKVLP